MKSDDMDIFFYEAFEEEKAALESCLPDTLHAGFTAAAIQETDHKTPPAKLISIRTQSAIPPDWSGKLSAILSRSAGYDHLETYRNTTGTPAALGYLPLYCARAVAEQALLLWMALLRKLPQQISRFSTFNRDRITGEECEGKNLLVVGVGNIGSEIVRLGQRLGMKVYGADPVRRHEFVDYVEYDDAKADADVIACAMNLTEENRGYFDEQRLAGLKPTALFINIARGELSPPSVLLDSLKRGTLGGAGLDVYDEEKELATALRAGIPDRTPAIHSILELQQLPNVICTPHNAFNTHEAVMRKSEQSVRQAEYFLQTGRFIWNIPD
jgi:D-lactate dehydrogenase